ncbi:hypothetical protein [Streptomyces sp. NPDC002328]|uniref:hypothetical protein n=1 Tax=Streptomyces sp. NPDC002328 TaxID=3364642 RepID=UPI003676DFA2
MTPPPPPASARFPDAPPARDAGWTTRPPRLPAQNPETRPSAPGSADVPPPRPATARPVRLETIRPAASDGTDGGRTPGPARPDGPEGDGPARPGVTRPARLDGTHPAGAGGARSAAGPEGTRTPGPSPSRPARLDGMRTAGPEGEAPPRVDGTRPAAPEGDRPARPGVTRPARLDSTRPTPTNTDRPAGPSGTAASNDEHPARPGTPAPGNRPTHPGTAAPYPDHPARPAPAAPAGERPSRPGTAVPGSDRPARPADATPHPDRPARPAAAPGGDRPARPGTASSDTGRPARPGTTAPYPDRPTRPPVVAPVGEHPARPGTAAPSGTPLDSGPRPSGDAAQAPVSGAAWTPLPRGWAPAPVQPPRDSLSSAVPGQSSAWSPASPVRHPDFDVPADRERPADPPVVPPRPPADPVLGGGPTPDPALSWSAPTAPGHGATRPEGYGKAPSASRRRFRGHTLAAATCVVLGLGLIGGAVTGSWLVGDTADAGKRSAYTAAAGLWHNVPVDQLFPPTVDGQGAGPGGADRTWTRVAVAPDSGCAGALDPLLLQALAPVGCSRLLRATYTDATQSYVTTVGLLFTKADAAGMRALDARFDKEGLARRTDLMPRPYAAPDTVAAAFGDAQRASWTVSVLTDAPVVVYAVSGWADGRTVAAPEPAAQATASGATTAPAQAGLGNEAKGLADRVERGLRKTAAAPSEQPS